MPKAHLLQVYASGLRTSQKNKNHIMVITSSKVATCDPFLPSKKSFFNKNFPGWAHTPKPTCSPDIWHVRVLLYNTLMRLPSPPWGFLIPDMNLIPGLSKVIYLMSNGHYTTSGHLSGHFYSHRIRPLHGTSDHFCYTHCPYTMLCNRSGLWGGP